MMIHSYIAVGVSIRRIEKYSNVADFVLPIAATNDFPIAAGNGDVSESFLKCAKPCPQICVDRVVYLPGVAEVGSFPHRVNALPGVAEVGYLSHCVNALPGVGEVGSWAHCVNALPGVAEGGYCIQAR